MEILQKHSINQSKLSRLSGYTRITDDKLVNGSRLMARQVKKDILIQFLSKCVKVMDERCLYVKLDMMKDFGFMALNKPYKNSRINLDRFYKKYPHLLELKIIKCYNDIVLYLLDFDT